MMNRNDGIMPENDYLEPVNSPTQISTYAELDFFQESNTTQSGSDNNNHNPSEDAPAKIDGYTEFSPAPPPRPSLASSNNEIPFYC